MKYKEKQIEEMAKVIDDRLIEARSWLGSMNRGEGYWIAQKLVEHYQPKLPEDSVVLSREEYEKLKTLEEGHITCEDMLEFVEKARKETADKIFNDIFKLEVYDDGWNKTYYKDHIEKLAKQFGVEIKE